MASRATVYRNCLLVNVFTGETLPSDIVVCRGVIARVAQAGLAQPGPGDEVVDCSGLYATPGLMDAHFHTESTLVSLREIARLVVPHGTTSIFINPHEIANVMGIEGVKALLEDAKGLPLRVFLVAPCKVPTAPGLETSGASFGCEEVREMLKWPETVAAGEFDASDLLEGLEGQVAILGETLSLGKVACGHGPGLVGEGLQAAVAMGLADDHESHGAWEVLEKLRAGMTVFLREGTTERNVATVVREIVGWGHGPGVFRNLAFCTDDKHPLDILENGHIDLNVRLAIASGMPPVDAVRCATLACAEHYGLNALGALATGRQADIVFVRDLADFRPDMVVVGGVVVVRGGSLVPGALGPTPYPTAAPAFGLGSCHCGDLSDLEERLAIRCHGSTCMATVIGVMADQILTARVARGMDVGSDGKVLTDPGRGINKVAVLDRYTASGRVGLAFTEGFGLSGGAIASSVAHDHHNLVAVGDADGDIAVALRELARMNGGLVAVRSGVVVAGLPLPIAGLISDMAAEAVNEALRRLNAAAAEMGCPLPAPFMTLSFITLPVVPELGITDMGLIDVRLRRVLPPVRALGADDMRSTAPGQRP